jgi:hypothetical protein
MNVTIYKLIMRKFTHTAEAVHYIEQGWGTVLMRFTYSEFLSGLALVLFTMVAACAINAFTSPGLSENIIVFDFAPISPYIFIYCKQWN